MPKKKGKVIPIVPGPAPISSASLAATTQASPPINASTTQNGAATRTGRVETSAII
jgi:hypothetical protein